MFEKHVTQVWVSWETYRRLLAIRGEMWMRDGKIRDFDEVIGELVAFWKKECSKVLKEVEL